MGTPSPSERDVIYGRPLTCISFIQNWNVSECFNSVVTPGMSKLSSDFEVKGQRSKVKVTGKKCKWVNLPQTKTKLFPRLLCTYYRCISRAEMHSFQHICLSVRLSHFFHCVKSVCYKSAYLVKIFFTMVEQLLD